MRVTTQIGKGASATVHTVNWLGMDVAKKMFQSGLDDGYFQQEVSVLQGVFHANVMSFLCCTH